MRLALLSERGERVEHCRFHIRHPSESWDRFVLGMKRLAHTASDPSVRWGDGKISRSADDPHDVTFLHDQQVFTVELDFGAGPFAEQDAVASFDIQGNAVA